MTTDTIRVRIAPSPTGNLHIGTTRTALFNYLYARHMGGRFVLRVEDTDQERSNDEYTQNILEGFKGLGLNWDEGPDVGGDFGPYAQSERTELYTAALNKLIESKQAYPCFCTPEELQIEREQAEKSGQTYVYSGKYRDLSAAEAAERIAKGEAHVYRLKVPSKAVVFNDLIRGNIEIHTDILGDFIIAKGLNRPIYNFAVVVDDLGMKITHVLRGEDHISNTPKQILIYEALNEPVPQFGHTAMILAPDRSKLSKRHGATAISDYLAEGYLPEGLINYLALLGWSAPEGSEILSLDELVSLFSLDKVGKSGSVFDTDKLKWVNAQWIKKLSGEQLYKTVLPFVASEFDLSTHSEEWLTEAFGLVQEKVSLLTEFKTQLDFFLVPELVYQADLVGKAFKMESATPVLKALEKALPDTDNWNVEAVQETFAVLKSELDFKMKQIMWPIRAALSGRIFGPDLQKSIVLLGKEQVEKRIHNALKEIGELAHV